MEFVGDSVIPLTEDCTCPFLDKDYKCVIYKHRPEVCQKFGDESHPLLVCPYKN